MKRKTRPRTRKERKRQKIEARIKRQKIEAQRRTEKNKARTKRENIITTSFLIGIFVCIPISGYFAYHLLIPLLNPTIEPPNLTTESNKIKAAIVDQLSYTDLMANKTFVDEATSILQEAGYEVDYIDGQRVTVEFYRELGIKDYRLIILRVHSVLGENKTPPLALFTSEPHSTSRYRYEQRQNQTTRVYFTSDVYNDTTKYFGVTSKFIEERMYGDFQNATIIMMGCDGFRYVGYDLLGNEYYWGDMAMAFIERGAKVYISWTGGVLGSYTDAATIHLLRDLITQRKTVWESVINTWKEGHWDPYHLSRLQYYPQEARDYKIPEVEKYDPG